MITILLGLALLSWSSVSWAAEKTVSGPQWSGYHIIDSLSDGAFQKIAANEQVVLLNDLKEAVTLELLEYAEPKLIHASGGVTVLGWLELSGVKNFFWTNNSLELFIFFEDERLETGGFQAYQQTVDGWKLSSRSSNYVDISDSVGQYQQRYNISSNKLGYIKQIAASPDGQRLAVVYKDKTFKMFDVETFAVPRDLQDGLSLIQQLVLIYLIRVHNVSKLSFDLKSGVITRVFNSFKLDLQTYLKHHGYVSSLVDL